MLVKVTMPVEAGNVAARSGFQALESILQDLKPEAAYFYAEHGKRSALLIIQMEEASRIPAIAEPFFMAFNATIEFQPVMLPEDLRKAAPDIERAAKKYLAL
jgi:hypothetical protein